ncbi:MAG: hypothetical protein GYA55_06495, partial [SAR324 cluster bacterium]|nr:hypothetical protein [SAR324 cluster bacterium]
MFDYLFQRPDFLFFLQGLSLVLAADLCRILDETRTKIPWWWLRLFCLFQASFNFVEVACVSWSHISILVKVAIYLNAGSWLALLEFSRTLWNVQMRRTLGRWIFLPVLCILGFAAWQSLEMMFSVGFASLGVIAILWSALSLVASLRSSHKE